MTREERLKLLKQIEKDIYVCSIESTFLDDAKSCAIHSIIEELEQESDTWSLDDAREDFMSDVYDTLDFLPTNNEANRIIDSFDRVTNGIKQELKTEWIPVSERLPKEEGLYLVSVKNEHNRRYSKTCWFHGNGNWFVRQDVIAWMPLPEPYKAESKE